MLLQEKLVKRALRATDPDLSLVEYWHPYGFHVYAVKYDIGFGVEPLQPLTWVGGDGKPLPLSLSLVDRLRSQEGDVSQAIRSATRNNIEKKKRARAERMAVQEDLIEEYHRWDKRGFVKQPTGVTSS